MSKRQELFNQAAENWDREYDNPKLQSFLKRFVPSLGLEAGQSVLDVGTGTGVLVPFLSKAVGSTGHITAIDYAQRMVGICKTKYAHLPNVVVKIGDAENLQFSAASFNAVTCFGVFPHLANKEDALNQFHRVLKPKGKLIIAHALSSAEIRRHHQNAPSLIANDVLPDETGMRELLGQAGFTEIQILDAPGCYLCTSVKP